MNQILSVELKKDKKKKTKSSGPVEIKKVIVFFCILTMILGIGMTGQGTYGIVKNIDSNKNTLQQGNNANVTVDRDGNNIIIRVTHDKEIKRLIYRWNDEEENTIEGNGSNTLEQTIELPIGNNKLYITVEDILGKTTLFEKDYVTDATEPQIAIEANGNKLKITAKDNVALSYITYRWDQEEEVKVDAVEGSEAQIECEIDIPRGQHTLTVVAVNSNNKTVTKTQEVKVVTKPQITVNYDPNDYSYIIMTATDENRMVKMQFSINNGQLYELDYSKVNEKKIEWRTQVQPGENQIKVYATNGDGVTEEVTVKYQYNP